MNKEDCKWYKDGICGVDMPDSQYICRFEDCLICEPEQYQWDNKFGKVAIEGVGKDAETVVNENGGMQAKAPMAMHLVSPNYLREFFENKRKELEYVCDDGDIQVDKEDENLENLYTCGENIAIYMQSDMDDYYLTAAMDCLVPDTMEQPITIAKVLQEGAEKYPANNWRLIPEEEHINHALIHLVALIMGDTQDDHRGHCLARLMMAKDTYPSANFKYGEFVKDEV